MMVLTVKERARQVCVSYGLITTDLDKDREHPLERYIREAIHVAEQEAEERGAERERLGQIAELRKFGFWAAADALVEVDEKRKQAEPA